MEWVGVTGTNTDPTTEYLTRDEKRKKRKEVNAADLFVELEGDGFRAPNGFGTGVAARFGAGQLETLLSPSISAPTNDSNGNNNR